MKRRKRPAVQVFPSRPKVQKPKPDCPNCKRGLLVLKEYVEVATEERDESRTRVSYCPKCEWIL